MYCGNCGTKLEDNQTICPACGINVQSYIIDDSFVSENNSEMFAFSMLNINIHDDTTNINNRIKENLTKLNRFMLPTSFEVNCSKYQL